MFLLSFFFAERRPLKSSTQVPLFRSPSARLVQHDKLLTDDAYRGSDGSIVCSLGGMNNKEVHHYTFQPSKQIVSNLFELQLSQFNVIGHLSKTRPLSAIVDCYLRLRYCVMQWQGRCERQKRNSRHYCPSAEHYELKYLTRKQFYINYAKAHSYNA